MYYTAPLVALTGLQVQGVQGTKSAQGIREAHYHNQTKGSGWLRWDRSVLVYTYVYRVCFCSVEIAKPPTLETAARGRQPSLSPDQRLRRNIGNEQGEEIGHNDGATAHMYFSDSSHISGLLYAPISDNFRSFLDWWWLTLCFSCSKGMIDNQGSVIILEYTVYHWVCDLWVQHVRISKHLLT
jgi:hypothetical protein